MSPHLRLASLLRRRVGVHFARVLAAPLDAHSPMHASSAQYQCAALSDAEALEWCADPELELTADQVLFAYARGDVCVALKEAGRPVGYVWFGFDCTPHMDGAWVRFPGFARYLYKSFLLPSHRGRGLGAELMRRASAACPRRGRTIGVLLVDLDNVASLRASCAAGFRPAGYAGFTCLAGRLFAFRSPGARRCGVEFVQAPDQGSGTSPSSLSRNAAPASRTSRP